MKLKELFKKESKILSVKIGDSNHFEVGQKLIKMYGEGDQKATIETDIEVIKIRHDKLDDSIEVHCSDGRVLYFYGYPFAFVRMESVV